MKNENLPGFCQFLFLMQSTLSEQRWSGKASLCPCDNRSSPQRGQQKKPRMQNGQNPSLICFRGSQQWGLHPFPVILPMVSRDRKQKSGEGRASANLRRLFSAVMAEHQEFSLFSVTDGLYFLALPSGAVSSAWKPSLHPEIYYFTNPNMSEIVLHLHFKPDKIIFRVTFFPWRQLQIEYFLPCYLSLPLSFQANFTFRLQITLYQERPQSTAAIFSSPTCRGRPGSASPTQVYPRRESSPAVWNIFIARISEADHGVLPDASEWNGSCYTPKEGKAERQASVCISGMHLSSMALAPSILCNTGDRVGCSTFCLRNLFEGDSGCSLHSTFPKGNRIN